MYSVAMALPKELVAASSRPLVLAILAGGESYGYAILQEVRRQSGGAITWTDGMLYPVLHRLEQQRLVAARWRVGDSGRRRKYYRLTEAGKKALAKERAQWEAVHGTLSKLWRNMPCPS
jgi:DNA-binding PadR family transcriptional regulator